MVTGNFKEVSSFIRSVPKQASFAASQTINQSLFDIRKKYIGEFASIFDRPNISYLSKAFNVDKSTKSKLNGYIEIKPDSLGKGSAPAQVLSHHIYSGDRALKKFEKAMVYSGYMTAGMRAVPGPAAELDAYGGMSGRFTSKLLSYFNAYSKAGFKANMTQKKKDRMAKFGKSSRGYKRIGGAVYFLSGGKHGFGGIRNHLAPGIWKKSGIHGSIIEPVVLFVKSPVYKKRFDFYGIANQHIKDNFNRQFGVNLQNALKGSK